MTPPGVVVSCDPEFREVAAEELRPLLGDGNGMLWLDGEAGFARPASAFAAFAAAVAEAAPVFVRHLQPVDAVARLGATEEDLLVLTDAAAGLGSRIDPARSFSVQTRILGEGKLPYRRVAVNEALSARLEEVTGARMNAPAPEQVVSVLCTPTEGLLGVSRTEQNLSAWPGGRHRFRNEEGQVSRSEHKLLEALSLFGVALPEGGTALDMGAAPGGWTRILRRRGLRVVAVDPADLDPRVGGDAEVRHDRRKIDDFLRGSQAGPFDAVVNDMRMDARLSVEVMLRAGPRLKPGGIGVITLKLESAEREPRRLLEVIRGHVARLRGGYAIVGVRHLFHNRSEVTVALRRT